METIARTLSYKDYSFLAEYTPCSQPAKDIVLLVNGALATSASYRNWKRYFADKANVVSFDFPFYGKSKEVNSGRGIITLEDEANILKIIIDTYHPNIIASTSWGGMSAMKILGSGNHGIKRAIITSFSFGINEIMRNYIFMARNLMKENCFHELAELMNEEVGENLPRKMKSCNYDHLIALDDNQYKQAIFHVEQIQEIPVKDYLQIIEKNDCEFIFINGELDKHTTYNEIHKLCHKYTNTSFHQLKNTGHFLDLEGKESRQLLIDVFDSIFSQKTNPTKNDQVDYLQRISAHLSASLLVSEFGLQTPLAG